MNFLGIDGGGSKTAFLLEDDSGRQLARVETGPSNWLSAGIDAARKSIADGLRQLPATPDVVCAGFAGAGRPEGVGFYESTLHSLLPHARVFIETDAFVAFVGAIGIKPGVLLIAGTGSIAISRQADGAMSRVGGWGPMFGDEGSGFWIGREAIRTALRAFDTHTLSPFVSSIANALGQNSIVEAIPNWTSGALSVRTVASLASLLLDQYPGEPAKGILEAAALHLRALVESAIRQSRLPAGCDKTITGSLGNQAVLQKLIGLEFRPAAQPPECGAIQWARARITGA